MGLIDDYINGEIAEKVKFGLDILEAEKETIVDSETGESMLKEIENFDPVLIDIEELKELIQNSEKCAIGPRSCMALLPDSTFTESVYLDELGEALVNAGKAEFVSKAKAIGTMEKYKSKMIASRISGKYMEICRTFSKTCIYWNMEKYGLKCIRR